MSRVWYECVCLSVCLSVCMVVEEDGEVFSLRQQVATLAQALSTVTEEKSKMESSFQQDKRSVLVSRESYK